MSYEPDREYTTTAGEHVRDPSAPKVYIPYQALRDIGVEPGDDVDIEWDDDRIVLQSAGGDP